MIPKSVAERMAFLDRSHAKKVGKVDEPIQSVPSVVINQKNKRKNDVKTSEVVVEGESET